MSEFNEFEKLRDILKIAKGEFVNHRRPYSCTRSLDTKDKVSRRMRVRLPKGYLDLKQRHYHRRFQPGAVDVFDPDNSSWLALVDTSTESFTERNTEELGLDAGVPVKNAAGVVQRDSAGAVVLRDPDEEMVSYKTEPAVPGGTGTTEDKRYHLIRRCLRNDQLYQYLKAFWDSYVANFSETHGEPNIDRFGLDPTAFLQRLESCADMDQLLEKDLEDESLEQDLSEGWCSIHVDAIADRMGKPAPRTKTNVRKIMKACTIADVPLFVFLSVNTRRPTDLERSVDPTAFMEGMAFKNLTLMDKFVTGYLYDDDDDQGLRVRNDDLLERNFLSDRARVKLGFDPSDKEGTTTTLIAAKISRFCGADTDAVESESFYEAFTVTPSYRATAAHPYHALHTARGKYFGLRIFQYLRNEFNRAVRPNSVKADPDMMKRPGMGALSSALNKGNYNVTDESYVEQVWIPSRALFTRNSTGAYVYKNGWYPWGIHENKPTATKIEQFSYTQSYQNVDIRNYTKLIKIQSVGADGIPTLTGSPTTTTTVDFRPQAAGEQALFFSVGDHDDVMQKYLWKGGALPSPDDYFTYDNTSRKRSEWSTDPNDPAVNPIRDRFGEEDKERFYHHGRYVKAYDFKHPTPRIKEIRSDGLGFVQPWEGRKRTNINERGVTDPLSDVNPGRPRQFHKALPPVADYNDGDYTISHAVENITLDPVTGDFKSPMVGSLTGDLLLRSIQDYWKIYMQWFPYSTYFEKLDRLNGKQIYIVGVDCDTSIDPPEARINRDMSRPDVQAEQTKENYGVFPEDILYRGLAVPDTTAPTFHLEKKVQGRNVLFYMDVPRSRIRRAQGSIQADWDTVDRKVAFLRGTLTPAALNTNPAPIGDRTLTDAELDAVHSHMFSLTPDDPMFGGVFSSDTQYKGYQFQPAAGQAWMPCNGTGELYGRAADVINMAETKAYFRKGVTTYPPQLLNRLLDDGLRNSEVAEDKIDAFTGEVVEKAIRFRKEDVDSISRFVEYTLMDRYERFDHIQTYQNNNKIYGLLVLRDRAGSTMSARMVLPTGDVIESTELSQDPKRIKFTVDGVTNVDVSGWAPLLDSDTGAPAPFAQIMDKNKILLYETYDDTSELELDTRKDAYKKTDLRQMKPNSDPPAPILDRWGDATYPKRRADFTPNLLLDTMQKALKGYMLQRSIMTMAYEYKNPNRVGAGVAGQSTDPLALALGGLMKLFREVQASGIQASFWGLDSRADAINDLMAKNAADSMTFDQFAQYRKQMRSPEDYPAFRPLTDSSMDRVYVAALGHMVFNENKFYRQSADFRPRFGDVMDAFDDLFGFVAENIKSFDDLKRDYRSTETLFRRYFSGYKSQWTLLLNAMKERLDVEGYRLRNVCRDHFSYMRRYKTQRLLQVFLRELHDENRPFHNHATFAKGNNSAMDPDYLSIALRNWWDGCLRFNDKTTFIGSKESRFGTVTFPLSGFSPQDLGCNREDHNLILHDRVVTRDYVTIPREWWDWNAGPTGLNFELAYTVRDTSAGSSETAFQVGMVDAVGRYQDKAYKHYFRDPQTGAITGSEQRYFLLKQVSASGSTTTFAPVNTWTDMGTATPAGVLHARNAQIRTAGSTWKDPDITPTPNTATPTYAHVLQQLEGRFYAAGNAAPSTVEWSDTRYSLRSDVEDISGTSAFYSGLGGYRGRTLGDVLHTSGGIIHNIDDERKQALFLLMNSWVEKTTATGSQRFYVFDETSPLHANQSSMVFEPLKPGPDTWHARLNRDTLTERPGVWDDSMYDDMIFGKFYNYRDPSLSTTELFECINHIQQMFPDWREPNVKLSPSFQTFRVGFLGNMFSYLKYRPENLPKPKEVSVTILKTLGGFKFSSLFAQKNQFMPIDFEYAIYHDIYFKKIQDTITNKNPGRFWKEGGFYRSSQVRKVPENRIPKYELYIKFEVKIKTAPGTVSNPGHLYYFDRAIKWKRFSDNRHFSDAAVGVSSVPHKDFELEPSNALINKSNWSTSVDTGARTINNIDWEKVSQISNVPDQVGFDVQVKDESDFDNEDMYNRDEYRDQLSAQEFGRSLDVPAQQWNWGTSMYKANTYVHAGQELGSFFDQNGDLLFSPVLARRYPGLILPGSAVDANGFAEVDVDHVLYSRNKFEAEQSWQDRKRLRIYCAASGSSGKIAKSFIHYFRTLRDDEYIPRGLKKTEKRDIGTDTVSVIRLQDWYSRNTRVTDMVIRFTVPVVYMMPDFDATQGSVKTHFRLMTTDLQGNVLSSVVTGGDSLAQPFMTPQELGLVPIYFVEFYSDARALVSALAPDAAPGAALPNHFQSTVQSVGGASNEEIVIDDNLSRIRDGASDGWCVVLKGVVYRVIYAGDGNEFPLDIAYIRTKIIATYLSTNLVKKTNGVPDQQGVVSGIQYTAGAALSTIDINLNFNLDMMEFLVKSIKGVMRAQQKALKENGETGMQLENGMRIECDNQIQKWVGNPIRRERIYWEATAATILPAQSWERYRDAKSTVIDLSARGPYESRATVSTDFNTTMNFSVDMSVVVRTLPATTVVLLEKMDDTSGWRISLTPQGRVEFSVRLGEASASTVSSNALDVTSPGATAVVANTVQVTYMRDIDHVDSSQGVTYSKSVGKSVFAIDVNNALTVDTHDTSPVGAASATADAASVVLDAAAANETAMLAAATASASAVAAKRLVATAAEAAESAALVAVDDAKRSRDALATADSTADAAVESAESAAAAAQTTAAESRQALLASDALESAASAAAVAATVAKVTAEAALAVAVDAALMLSQTAVQGGSDVFLENSYNRMLVGQSYTQEPARLFDFGTSSLNTIGDVKIVRNPGGVALTTDRRRRSYDALARPNYTTARAAPHMELKIKLPRSVMRKYRRLSLYLEQNEPYQKRVGRKLRKAKRISAPIVRKLLSVKAIRAARSSLMKVQPDTEPTLDEEVSIRIAVDPSEALEDGPAALAAPVETGWWRDGCGFFVDENSS